MCRLFSTSTIIFAILAGLCPLSAAPKGRLSKKQLAEKELRSFYLSLDRRLFGEKDYKAVQKLLKKSASDDLLRPLVISLLAQYHRRMERDPIAAMCVLAPEVLGKDAGRQWARNLRSAQQKAKQEYAKQALVAKRKGVLPPPEPNALAIAFPRKQMKISSTNVDCALEVARCLMELNQVQEALAIIDAQGKTFQHGGRVLAFECLGDLTLKLSMLNKAVGAYNNSLGLMKQLKPTEGHDEWQKRVIARIQRKLAEAKRLQEIEKYGKGYVLYRDAETKRLKHKAHGEAILVYQLILAEFPKTIYGEAARAYTIKCRLALAEHKSRPKGLAKAISHWQKKIADEEAFIKLAKKHKVPKASLADLEAGKAKMVARMNQIKAIAIGEKSYELAKKEAQAFVDDGLYGLYRGEALVAIAEFAFARELNPERADKYFRQAWAWLSKVEGIDETVKTYQIPTKARKIAAPSQTAVKKDQWGNIDRQSQRVGVIVNRRTCNWYLDDLRARTVMAIGFLCFYEKKNKEAIEWYRKVLKYDEKNWLLAEGNHWNDFTRLKWGCDHGYLFAYPDELKAFARKHRFGVMLADFYYCSERNRKALAVIDRLDSMKVNKALKIYLCVLKGCVLNRTDGMGRKPAFAQFEKGIALAKTGSFTKDRLLLYASNTGLWLGGQAAVRSHKYLKELASSPRDNEFSNQGKIYYGIRLINTGREEEGKRIALSVSQKWQGTAKYFLEENTKKEDPQDNEE